jgi:hypothetical protein
MQKKLVLLGYLPGKKSTKKRWIRREKPVEVKPVILNYGNLISRADEYSKTY